MASAAIWQRIAALLHLSWGKAVAATTLRISDGARRAYKRH
jgi:hypothetical protein